MLEVWMEGKHIGNVPTSKTMEVSRHPRTQSGTVIIQLMFIRQHNMYTAKVFTPNRSEPTEKMKNAVNQILEKYPSLEKPEYTFDAYRQFLNEHKGGQVKQLRTKVIEIIV